MLHAPDLLHRLIGLRFGRPVYLFQHLGSTNDQARRLAEGGAPEGLMVVAEEQTAGRGRLQRRWLTPPGSALAVSLVLRPPLTAAQAMRLTMLAGLAVCEAAERVAGLRPELKWPNDVLIGGRKTAGILVDSAFTGDALEYAVLGIGVNVSWAPAPEAVDFPATCLEAEAGRPVDRLTLLRALLTAVETRYDALAGEAVFADWRARLGRLGAPAELHTEAGRLIGVAEDVTPEGALVFRTEAGEVRHVLAGDLRLRPRQAD
ncbi:MAG: biotin--[acetyl-CoA-carboxylase] ligase [Anaerolineales bacterium]|nr:biotin--[acetyl-CoA-carboxylase] ligase [Anaerolineales bacterium]